MEGELPRSETSLIAVGARSNRQQSDQGFAAWMPIGGAHSRYLGEWGVRGPDVTLSYGPVP